MSNPAKYLHFTHYSAVITMRVSVIRIIISVMLYLKLVRRTNTPKLHLVVKCPEDSDFGISPEMNLVFFF